MYIYKHLYILLNDRWVNKAAEAREVRPLGSLLTIHLVFVSILASTWNSTNLSVVAKAKEWAHKLFLRSKGQLPLTYDWQLSSLQLRATRISNKSFLESIRSSNERQLNFSLCFRCDFIVDSVNLVFKSYFTSAARWHSKIWLESIRSIVIIKLIKSTVGLNLVDKYYSI